MSCCGYVLHDQVTGLDICDNCGHAIDNINFFIPPLISNVKDVELISNICANNHIPEAISSYASHLYEVGDKQTEVYSAYCVYKACNFFNASRTLKEICVMFGVPYKEVTKHDIIISIKPSELLPRICIKLKIENFKLITELAKKVDEVYTYVLISSPPQSIIALVLHVCPFVHFSINQIAEACEISLSCLRRLARLYTSQIESYWPPGSHI